MSVSYPAPFPGTPEEAAANRATHHYDWQFGRCYDCDCRPSYTAADYPCGATVPRITR